MCISNLEYLIYHKIEVDNKNQNDKKNKKVPHTQFFSPSK